jgi:hypothetical protein
MALSNSLHSYTDCLDFFERVVDDPKGGRCFIGTYEDAHYFRMRCNQARKLHRLENAKVHAEGSKMHGHSEYDPLCLRLKMDTDHKWYVYAERMHIDASQIDLLSEINDRPQLEDHTPLAIEDHSREEQA